MCAGGAVGRACVARAAELIVRPTRCSCCRRDGQHGAVECRRQEGRRSGSGTGRPTGCSTQKITSSSRDFTSCFELFRRQGTFAKRARLVCEVLVRLWRAHVGVRRSDRPLDARALRYRGGAQMSAPPSEPALSALPPSAQPSSAPSSVPLPSGPLRPLSHTEPHTPSHATTPARFSCCRCGFESHVDYHGRTPPFNRSVVFLEAVYLIRSPMGDASRPLCLGGTCVVWCATTTPSLSHHHAWHTLTSEPRLRAAPLAWRLMLTR